VSVVRALRLDADGLKLEEVDPPVPGESDVLMRVHAAAIRGCRRLTFTRHVDRAF
jgi:NADPH:quinone reductase-like Zn-dependent oxidoreductase